MVLGYDLEDSIVVERIRFMTSCFRTQLKIIISNTIVWTGDISLSYYVDDFQCCVCTQTRLDYFPLFTLCGLYTREFLRENNTLRNCLNVIFSQDLIVEIIR